MATNCCTNGLNQVFCNAFNKYYNTLYANGEISKEETNNLLIIDYIRQCLSDERYNSYYNILLKALRCIANNSCLLDISWLYNRSIVPRVTNEFVTILTKQPFVEKDPVFMASPAATITQEEIYNWNHPSALGSLIVTVDPYSLLDNPSYDEIYTAWSSGLDVVAKLGDDSGIFQLSYIDSGTIMFIRSDNWNGIYVQYLLLEVEGNTETWTLSSDNYLQKIRTVKSELVTSNAVTITLDATKYHVPDDEVDTITMNLPSSYTAADEFVLCFTCKSSSCTVNLPTGVVLADNCDNFSEVAAGVFFQVSIMNDVAAYLCVTPTTP